MTLIAPRDTPSIVYPNTAVSTLKEELTLVDRGQSGTMTEVPSGPSAGRRRSSRAGRGSFLASGRCLALAVMLQVGNIHQQNPALQEALVECLEHPKKMSPQLYPLSIMTRIHN